MPNPGNAPARTPTCHPERRHLAKGLCKSCYDKQRAASRDKVVDNARKREWSKANPEKRRATHRKYLYGVDAETVAARLRAQDGKCKICREAAAAHLDHDHVTGKARGLLCGNCNRALGLFKEKPASLLRAVRYLAIWKGTG